MLKVAIKNDNVTPVKADVSDVDAIAKLADGKDAVISAYNPGWGNPEAKKLVETFQIDETALLSLLFGIPKQLDL